MEVVGRPVKTGEEVEDLNPRFRIEMGTQVLRLRCAQGLSEVAAEPGDGLGGAVAHVARGGDGAEAVDDLALDEAGEIGSASGSVEERDQAETGIEHRGGGAADCEAGGDWRRFGLGEFFGREDLVDDAHVELEQHGEERFSSEASTIWLSTGTSMEESRKDDLSAM
jgi:hypothetical protein